MQDQSQHAEIAPRDRNALIVTVEAARADPATQALPLSSKVQCLDPISLPNSGHRQNFSLKSPEHDESFFGSPTATSTPRSARSLSARARNAASHPARTSRHSAARPLSDSPFESQPKPFMKSRCHDLSRSPDGSPASLEDSSGTLKNDSSSMQDALPNHNTKFDRMKDDLSSLTCALDGLLASLSELRCANAHLKTLLYGMDKRSRAQVERIQQDFRKETRGSRTAPRISG